MSFAPPNVPFQTASGVTQAPLIANISRIRKQIIPARNNVRGTAGIIDEDIVFCSQPG